MASLASATHVNDETMTKTIGAFPVTERGVPSSIYTHPKEPRVVSPRSRVQTLSFWLYERDQKGESERGRPLLI